MPLGRPTVVLIDITVVLAGVLLPPVPMPQATPVEPPPIPIPLVAPAVPGPVPMPELVRPEPLLR